MNIILEEIDPSIPVRNHPYDGAKYDSRVRHYDLVKHPELIRQVLEDFKLWEQYAAIESFYQLLEWINGNDSIFESSDCRMEAPKQNLNKNMPYDLVLQGRLIIFFRDIKLNYAVIDPKNPQNYWVNPHVAALAINITEYLKTVYQDISWITIQLFFFPISYLQESGSPKLGQQITFQFNCYGNNEKDLFNTLKFFNLGILRALKHEDEQIRAEINCG
jgi:hypothetical protein